MNLNRKLSIEVTLLEPETPTLSLSWAWVRESRAVRAGQEVGLSLVKDEKQTTVMVSLTKLVVIDRNGLELTWKRAFECSDRFQAWNISASENCRFVPLKYFIYYFFYFFSFFFKINSILWENHMVRPKMKVTLLTKSWNRNLYHVESRSRLNYHTNWTPSGPVTWFTFLGIPDHS